MRERRQPWDFGAGNLVEAVLSAWSDVNKLPLEGDYLSVSEILEFTYNGIVHAANKASLYDGE